MNRFFTHSRRRRSWISRAGEWLDRNWFNAILLYVGSQFVLNNEVQIGIGQPAAAMGAAMVQPVHQKPSAQKAEAAFIPAANVSQFRKAVREEKPHGHKPAAAVPGFSIRNLSPLLSPESLRRRGIPEEIIEARLQVCKDYVARHAEVAKAEMKDYGIPASITLAQGLLESDAGESTLARQSNNHFGIKCRSKCLGCTCRNYSDDDIYDMFRVFESARESFREHSILLTSPRYKHLQKLGITDYKGWAKGLKAAGYATDPKYAEKLIKIIEALDLHQYDLRA